MKSREGRTFQYGLAREKREVVGGCGFSVVGIVWYGNMVTWPLEDFPFRGKIC